MLPVRVCRDCIHHDVETKNCLHPKAAQVDLVTGGTITLSSYTMRIHVCGSEGKLWEPWPDVGQAHKDALKNELKEWGVTSCQ